MKKLVFLLAIMAFGMMASAQSYTLTGTPGQTYFKSLTDVTITNTTAVWLQVNASPDFPTTQFAQIDVDSVSGNHTAVAVTLYGRNFDNESWTAISSGFTATDQALANVGVTTPVPKNGEMGFVTTTDVRYRQFKIVLTGTGTGVSKLDWFEFKLYSPD